VPCDVATVCFGTAASMGAFLLGAGARGKRRSLPNSRIMIHQPLGGAQGAAADIEIQAKEILFVRSCLNKCVASFCLCCPELSGNVAVFVAFVVFVVVMLQGGGVVVVILNSTLCCFRYIADFTGQPMSKVQEDCDRDFYMSPEEAVRGVGGAGAGAGADGIVGVSNKIHCCVASLASNLRLPFVLTCACLRRSVLLNLLWFSSRFSTASSTR